MVLLSGMRQLQCRTQPLTHLSHLLTTSPVWSHTPDTCGELQPQPLLELGHLHQLPIFVRRSWVSCWECDIVLLLFYNCSCSVTHCIPTHIVTLCCRPLYQDTYIVYIPLPSPNSPWASIWTELWGDHRYFSQHHLEATKGTQWSPCSLPCRTWSVPEWVNYKCNNTCQKTNEYCHPSFG